MEYPYIFPIFIRRKQLNSRQLRQIPHHLLIITRNRATLEVTSRHRPAGRLTAAAALPWLSDIRLLLATEDGPIYCVGLDDPLVTHYAAAQSSGTRVLAATASCVACSWSRT